MRGKCIFSVAVIGGALFAAQVLAVDDGVVVGAVGVARDGVAGVMEEGASTGPVQWESRVSFGMTFRSGNTDNENFSGGFETTKGFGNTLFNAAVDGTYETTEVVREDGTRHSDQTVGSAKAVVNIKQCIAALFVFGGVSVLHDDLADIRYRAIESLGVGTFLIKSDALRFSVEMGFAYIHEKAPEHDSYFGLRFAERLDWVMSEQFRMWEQVEAIPEASDFGNVLVSSEVGIESAISGALALSVKWKVEYDSEPAADMKRTDSLFLTQLTYKF